MKDESWLDLIFDLFFVLSAMMAIGGGILTVLNVIGGI